MQRVMLLDVDDVLIVDRVDRRSLAFANVMGSAPEPRPVPPGGCGAHIAGINGVTRRHVFWRPNVIGAIRTASRSGVDVIWNTSWLVNPDELARFARQVGLGSAVRFPRPGELPLHPEKTGIDTRPTELLEHWKTRAFTEHARRAAPGTQIVIVDDHLHGVGPTLADVVHMHTRRDDVVLGWITPHRFHGLTHADAGAIRRWARGGVLPRR